jgi:hypothetical protein
MRTTPSLLPLATITLIVATAGCGKTPTETTPATEQPLPIIMGLTPSSGTVGTPVIVDGAKFGAAPSETILYFYQGIPAQIDSMTDNRIFTHVPPGAATGTVSVLVKNLQSPGTTFAHFTVTE